MTSKEILNTHISLINSILADLDTILNDPTILVQNKLEKIYTDMIILHYNLNNTKIVLNHMIDIID